MIISRYCTFLVDVKYIESQEWEAFLDTHEELRLWLDKCLGPGVREYDGDAEQGEHHRLELDTEVRIDNIDITVQLWLELQTNSLVGAFSVNMKYLRTFIWSSNFAAHRGDV